jgi:hypothetical protein
MSRQYAGKEQRVAGEFSVFIIYSDFQKIKGAAALRGLRVRQPGGK